MGGSNASLSVVNCCGVSRLRAQRNSLLTLIHSLMARMPHTREKKGQVLPLQTPQAFTNRAHRFRVPNQIPASNPKNGSETYKKGILKNLAKKQITTTEGLSALDPEQVENVRKANKGKFKKNSRYVVKKDEDSAGTLRRLGFEECHLPRRIGSYSSRITLLPHLFSVNLNVGLHAHISGTSQQQITQIGGRQE